jgi:hypothetical protein
MWPDLRNASMARSTAPDRFQLALRKPVIEVHAEFVEIVADVGQHGVAREQHDGVEFRRA